MYIRCHEENNENINKKQLCTYKNELLTIVHYAYHFV